MICDDATFVGLVPSDFDGDFLYIAEEREIYKKKNYYKIKKKKASYV